MSTGGAIPRRKYPADYVPIQLSRGSVAMSRASIAAMDPEMLRKLQVDTDVYAVEDLLADLNEEGVR